MGWVPAHTLAAFKPPPRRIPTRAMPNREMVENSTQSKNWQAARQAWDSLQRQGILIGKTMPLMTFDREASGAGATARRVGRVDAVNLSPWTAGDIMTDAPWQKGFHLNTLLHEFAHTAQPRVFNPPSRGGFAELEAYIARYKAYTEGGAEAFSQLLAERTGRDLGRPSTPHRSASRQYSRWARDFRRKHGTSYALYGQFGLRDPNR